MTFITGFAMPTDHPGHEEPITVSIKREKIEVLIFCPYYPIGSETQKWYVIAVAGCGYSINVGVFASKPDAVAFVTNDPGGYLT